MLQAEEISFSYRKREILHNVSFALDKGECLVIAGPNGCGKTTLLSILAGVLKPSTGSVINPVGKIGLVPQGSDVFEDMTVRDNIRYFASLSHKKVPKELPYGLEEYAKKKAGILSGGQKKRLSLACTMISEPEIILFDEPCCNLDIVWRDELIRIIKELKKSGTTIVYVSHDIREFSEFYDRILFLGKGEWNCITKGNIPEENQESFFEEQIRLRTKD